MWVILQLDQDYNNYTRALESVNNAEDRIPKERRVYYLLEVYDALRANSYRLSEGLGYFQRYNEARKKLDELRTLHPKVNKLWSRYCRELQQVFPETHQEFSGQMMSIGRKLANAEQRLEKSEDLVKASQQLEEEKQQLSKISDLCLKIEKVHPILTRFNKICRYLMPEASSRNTEQILKNLNEPSGDSLLVRKIREAFGQDFQEFQKRLQDIDVCIRSMGIISKAPKDLENDTRWLTEKLRDCKKAKEQLIAKLKHKGFPEKTTSELTTLTLKGLYGICNTTYERIQAYMDSQGPGEEEMRKVISSQKLENIRACLRDTSYLSSLSGNLTITDAPILDDEDESHARKTIGGPVTAEPEPLLLEENEDVKKVRRQKRRVVATSRNDGSGTLVAGGSRSEGSGTLVSDGSFRIGSKIDEKDLPQRSEDLITHHARLSTLLKHFQVLEAALCNQHALSVVRESILYRDASQYQENITRGLQVFQVDTLSTNELEKITNDLNNNLEQMKILIQNRIERLKDEMYRYDQKTSEYLLYIGKAKSQTSRYHEGAFPEEFISQLKRNVQI